MTILNETEFNIDDVLSAAIDGYEAPQGSDEWFEERLGNATCSRFVAICARTKAGLPTAEYQKYMYHLLVERLTGKRRRFSSRPMEWGTQQEEAAVARYEEVTGNITSEVGFIKHPKLATGGSPDRLIGDLGQLEVKCPNTDTHLKYLEANKLPNEYFYQVHGQLWITGRKWSDFISHDPELPAGLDLFRVRVNRDEQIIKRIGSDVRTFLRELDQLESKLRRKISE